MKSIQNFSQKLEKSSATQFTTRNSTEDEKSSTCHKRINQELFDFAKPYFAKMKLCNF